MNIIKMDRAEKEQQTTKKPKPSSERFENLILDQI